MIATRTVVAVSPMSVPAALATGEAPVGSGVVPVPEAAPELVAVDPLVLLLVLPPLLVLLPLLDELHPAATTTAATTAAIMPA
jgi:hypothetical protein